MTQPRTARLAPTVALVATGALALSGCSTGLSSETAAVVDGKEITVEEVQQATEEFNSLPVTPTTTTDTLTLLIYGDLAKEAYRGAGGTPIPDAQLRAQLQGGGVADPSDSLLDLYRSITHLQAAQGLPSLDGVDIEVNPRFGAWDATAGQVIAQAPAWITEVTGAEAQN